MAEQGCSVGPLLRHREPRRRSRRQSRPLRSALHQLLRPLRSARSDSPEAARRLAQPRLPHLGQRRLCLRQPRLRLRPQLPKRPHSGQHQGLLPRSVVPPQPQAPGRLASLPLLEPRCHSGLQRPPLVVRLRVLRRLLVAGLRRLLVVRSGALRRRLVVRSGVLRRLLVAGLRPGRSVALPRHQVPLRDSPPWETRRTRSHTLLATPWASEASGPPHLEACPLAEGCPHP